MYIIDTIPVVYMKKKYGEQKGRNKKDRLRQKMFRAQNRELRCAQPASRRLLRKTAMLTQMLRQRSSATAN